MIAAFLSAAFAAQHEVDLEVGWLLNRSTSWNRVSDGSTFPSVGVRVGARLHRNVAAIAGWQHGQTGVSVRPDSDGDTYYYYEDYYTDGTSYDEGRPNGNFRTAFYGDTFTLGAKGDVVVNEYFVPYLTVQGALQRGLLRVDADASDDENLGQIQKSAVTGGFVGALGAECPVALGTSGIAVAPYVEVGYAWLAPLKFESIGSLEQGGFAGRAGFGLRF